MSILSKTKVFDHNNTTHEEGTIAVRNISSIWHIDINVYDEETNERSRYKIFTHNAAVYLPDSVLTNDFFIHQVEAGNLVIVH